MCSIVLCLLSVASGVHTALPKLALRVESIRHDHVLGDSSRAFAWHTNASMMQQRYELDDVDPCRTEQRDAVLVAIRAAGARPVCPRLTSNLFAAPTGQLMPRQAEPRRLSLDSPLWDLLACCIVATLSLFFWSAVFAHGSWRWRLLRAFTLLLLLQGAAWFLPAAEAARLDNAAPPFGKAASGASHSQVVSSAGASVRVYEAGEASPSSSAAASLPSATGGSPPSARAPPSSGLLSTEKALVPTSVRRLATTTVSPGAGTLQAALNAASAGDTLELTDGTYTGNGNSVLEISKDITIRAQNSGQAVLDGGNARRVISITSGTVTLEGLGITKGSAVSGGGVSITGSSTVTMSECFIYLNTASSANGGGVFANTSGPLIFLSCQIYSNTAGNEGLGGGVWFLGFSNSLTMTACLIYSNNAYRGGGVWLAALGSAVATFQSCQIYSNTASGSQYSYGGGIRSDGGTVHLKSCEIRSNQAVIGGGLHMLGGPLTMTDCNLHDNTANDSGGGLGIDGGTATLTATLIRDNSAPTGANVQPAGGILYYALPTPAGYWLPNADCVASRLPCVRGDVNCTTAVASGICATAGTSTDSPNAWTPSNCMPPLAFQTCEWQTAACAANPPTADCLLGKKLYFAPYLPIDATFPYPCAAGYLSSNDSAFQTSSDCAGKCPPGFFCPNASTIEAQLCPPGFFCLEGSSVPQPCPAGSSSNATGLRASSDCVTCPPGTSCSVSSTNPTLCLPGSFSATAGMQSCTLCPAGKFGDEYGQTACTSCTLGFYCEVGTAKPTPCPGGTFSSVLGATSEAACTPVSPGFWAGLGSSQPEPCPATGFYCPGKALDEKYGGSKPILVKQGGSTTTEEVETVQKDLTLDLSCADFDLVKVKQSLATQYNVDPLFITLTNPCTERRRARALQSGGGLTITISIAATATTADGAQVSAPPIATLLSTVRSVDDDALGTSLSTALGTALTVTSTAPIQATATVTVQSMCPPGFWCTAGLTVACEAGFYNPTTNANNQSACLPCPAHASTLGTSATSLSQCLCDAQYFNNHSSDTVLCLPCPVGTNCTSPGNTRDALPIKAGFWRKSNGTVDVRACADAAIGCSVGQSECAQTRSGCAGGTDSNVPCRPGLTGIFCIVCANSTAQHPHFYAAASDTSPATCSPCEEAFVLPFIAAVTAAIAPSALVLLGLRLPRTWRKRAARQFQVLDLSVKLKQTFSFYQIACKVGVVYEVTLPAAVAAFLSSFEIAITFGFDVTTPFECFGAGSYLQRLQFWIFAPLVLSIALFVCGTVLKRGRWRKGMLWALPLVIKLMFLLYTTVNLRAFEAFRCYDFGVDGRWLMADVKVACESPEHETIKGWAWLAIFLYPIGWTTTTALLLFIERKSILGRQKPTALSRALSFVYSEFEPAFFWWEVLEMARRFLLVGLMSIVLQGSIVQLVIAALFGILYLILQLQAKPYKEPSNDYVALASTASLSVLLWSCVVLKVGVLTDTPEVDAILPPRLRTNFNVPSALLSVVIFASVVFILAISMLIAIHQMRQDLRRRAAEARAAKARRLRYCANNAEVLPPALPGGHFHLFLSHTWAQGEEAMRTVKLRLLELMPDARVFLDKDDLKTGAGAEYIDVSSSMLCFCTKKYFESRACARELLRAVLRGKPLITVMEPDASRGGLMRRDIVRLLTVERYPPHNRKDAPASQDWVARWALDHEVAEWGYAAVPTGEQIVDALFKHSPIEWNRFSAFQDVTMRLVAERVLLDKNRGAVYVQGEVGSQALVPPALTRGRTYHLYCSPHNLGASAVGAELSGLVPESTKSSSASSLKVTTTLADLDQCEHMLLYLTSTTWTSGKASSAFTREVEQAQRLGVHLLLVHEFPSAMDDDASTRGACDFNDFWNDGWTPKHLLAGEANVYKQIAIALKPGAWRAAGLATVFMKMVEDGGERMPIEVSSPPAEAYPMVLEMGASTRPTTTEVSPSLEDARPESEGVEGIGQMLMDRLEALDA